LPLRPARLVQFLLNQIRYNEGARSGGSQRKRVDREFALQRGIHFKNQANSEIEEY
jgi:hypothetical protein